MERNARATLKKPGTPFEKRNAATVLTRLLYYPDSDVIKLWPGFIDLIVERGSKHILSQPGDFGDYHCYRCENSFNHEDPESIDCL